MKPGLIMLTVVLLGVTGLAKEDRRLAAAQTVFIEAGDPLSDDQPIAACLRDHLPTVTTLTISTRESADLVLTVRKAKIGGSTSRDLLNFLGLASLDASAGGAKIWDGYVNLTAPNKLEMQTSASVPCALADALAGKLRQAMRKARDQK